MLLKVRTRSCSWFLNHLTCLDFRVSPSLLREIFLCIPLYCSYGLTETTAILTRTVPGDPGSSGTVGPPQPPVEVKLVDVPSMGYTSQDNPCPRGEIWSRGPVNIPEYYKGEKFDFHECG